MSLFRLLCALSVLSILSGCFTRSSLAEPKDDFRLNEEVCVFGPNCLNLDKFFPIRSEDSSPYEFYINDIGQLTTTTGGGDFGLLVFERPLEDFVLTAQFKVPEGSFELANSGIFFGFIDPRIPLEDLTPGETWPSDWRSQLLNRTRAFLAAWTGVEVQLLAGARANEFEPSTQNGRFYGEENQIMHSEYRLDPGERYSVRVEKRGSRERVWMRWLGEENQNPDASETLVSELNRSNSESPRFGYLGIQSYYNNDGDFRALLFESLTLRLP